MATSEKVSSNKRKLTTRDLIIAGAFAAVYLVVLLGVVMGSGVIPILYLMCPLFLGIILGPIFSVYCTKLNKPGALLILAVLVGLVESMTGAWQGLAWAVPVGLVAELLARAGRYRSKTFYKMSYTVFALTNMGPFWIIVLARPAWLANCMKYYGADYVTTIDALTPPWIIFVFIALALVGGIIGAFLGQGLLKKHFEKAGVV
ncbi:MAG: MptD family putative ECF transporter S component [Coriobacteriales bacterium]|jgi:energy-coupling factor transport system substrate-specific component|nr:MptD family putative ECF transporter S component [Coriobacteriales bacterium]